MNKLTKNIAAVVILAGTTETALATWVSGQVYCDTNNSGAIEQTQDEVLPNVGVQAACTEATDPDSGHICTPAGLTYTTATDNDGFYRMDLLSRGELKYDVSLTGDGLPSDYVILEPVPNPASFGFPLTIDDEFLDPNYIVNDGGQLSYTRPYIARMDWLVASSACGNQVNPDINLVKEVSLDNGPWKDANSVDDAPAGSLGADARYRFTMTNTGNEPLYDLLVTDAELGIVDFPVMVNPVYPGQSVVISGSNDPLVPVGNNGESVIDIPSHELLVDNACDTRGAHLNTASVLGYGGTSGREVNAEDIAYILCEEPLIDLRKQVSLDGVHYFDADASGDTDVPVGIAAEASAYYRFIVTNTGSELLTDVRVTDATLGIDQQILDLEPGATQVIESGESGFSALLKDNVCEGSPGYQHNTATVTAEGDISGDSVSSSNPAVVKCIVGPALQVRKQVRVAETAQFMDADTAAEAVVSLPRGDGSHGITEYRFIIENVGDEALYNISVSDARLGITGVQINNLEPGAFVIVDGDTSGFENLSVAGLCDTSGLKRNKVQVTADGAWSGKAVNDADLAFVECEQPLECSLVVDQKCMVKEPASDDKLCTDAISATTLRYTGPNLSAATVVFKGKDSGQVIYNNVNLVSGVTILTRPGQNGFTIDAGIGEKLGSKTTITINGTEEIIHTSCSAIYVAGAPAPLDGNTPNPAGAEKGDPSPNWEVVDFREKDDDYVAEAPSLSEAMDACSIPYAGADVAFSYKITNTGTTQVNLESVQDAMFGEMLDTPPVALAAGESLTLNSDPYPFTQSITNQVDVLAYASGDTAVSCPASDTVLIEKADAPQLSCEDGKPAQLGITYVGGSCSDSNHDQDDRKASCSGDSTGASPVRLTLTDKKGEVYVSQVLAIGESLILDAAAIGKSKLDSETNAIIEDGSGVIQEINFHTSCSAPLATGDQHGGILISSFVPEEDGKGKKHKKDKKPKHDKKHKDHGKDKKHHDHDHKDKHKHKHKHKDDHKKKKHHK